MENNELTNRVAALELILNRERLARKEAENQLEDYSRELYEQGEIVEDARKAIEAQQSQLEFLTGLLAETWKQPSLKNIVANYLERTNNFMSKSHNIFIELHGDMSFHQFQYYWGTGHSNEKQQQIDEYKKVLLSLNRKEVYQQFENEVESQIFELDDICTQPHDNFNYCVMVPIYSLDLQTGKAIGIVILLYPSGDELNILKLQILESSRSMLSVAIQRKRAEESLQERLQELEQTNDVLEQTQQQLIQQEKLASLGQLAAGVAHEINNPVGFVLSNLDTMKDYFNDFTEILKPLNNTDLNLEQRQASFKNQWEELDGDFLLSDGQEILSSSVQGLERVKEIVSDLSTFSRMDNDELETIDLNTVIDKSLNVVSNELKYKHTIETNLLPSAMILGNAGKLQQVFINLFVNAKHAMPDGGKLTITSEKDRNKIVVRVKDEGCGIKKEHLDDIFTPFFTTKAPGEGTGLGLAISYSILQQHNAKVRVHTEINKGTEFEIGFYESF